MTIASLANPPKTSEEMDIWSFAHADIVHRTSALLNQQLGTAIEIQPLSNIPLFDVHNWLQRVQYAHNAINNALGTTGNDLTSLDIKKPDEVASWVDFIFTEALEWSQHTGIL